MTMEIQLNSVTKEVFHFLGRNGKTKLFENIKFSENNKIITLTYNHNHNKSIKIKAMLNIAINSKLVQVYNIVEGINKFDIIPNGIESNLKLDNVLRIDIEVSSATTIKHLWSCTGYIKLKSKHEQQKDEQINKIIEITQNKSKLLETLSPILNKYIKDNLDEIASMLNKNSRLIPDFSSFFLKLLRENEDEIKKYIEVYGSDRIEQIIDVLQGKLKGIETKYNSEIERLYQKMNKKLDKQKETFEHIIQYTTNAVMKDFYKTVESIKSQLMNEMSQLNTNIETMKSNEKENDQSDINEQLQFKVLETKTEIENLNKQLSEVTIHMKNEINSITENQMNVIKMGVGTDDDNFKWLND